jgi:hypothetical protein
MNYKQAVAYFCEVLRREGLQDDLTSEISSQIGIP